MCIRRLIAAGRSACTAFVCALAVTSLLAGCARPGKELQPGIYRATLELPGGKAVPFELDVAREESGLVMYLVNGDERVRVPEVEASPGKVVARMPGYENVITADVSGGDLRGKLVLVHGDDRRLELPFAAKLGESWRFYPEPLMDNADLAGRWSVQFTGDGGDTVSAVAQLEQSHHRVTGTVMTPADDQRYLAGEVHDEELRLSRFDGGAVMLYEARLNAKGELAGEFWSDRGGRQRFVATRDPDASIDSTAVATQLRDPDAGFAFSFPDLDRRLVSSTDPRFAGKVVLVSLTGSWCPNSHDEAGTLEALRRRFGDRGLEIVALMFEQHAEFDRAAAAVRRFRDARGIDYPTLIAGRSDKSLASQALPQLDAVRAYPTLVLIGRDGRVRKIHTGFSGPATGVSHELLVRELSQSIELLLAEGGTPVPTLPAATPGGEAAPEARDPARISPGNS